jgi:N-acyl-phosphatidylethanolamine-hydrolysing phospholipase D
MLVPAQHWSARGLADRMKTLWGGFAVFAPDCHLFYAGDTGYSRDFRDMRERFAPRHTQAQGGGFDLALLPIGAYEPRWFMAAAHMNPDEAVQAHLALGAHRSVGMHFGTFQLTDEAIDAPLHALAAARTTHGLTLPAFDTHGFGETRLYRLLPGA